MCWNSKAWTDQLFASFTCFWPHYMSTIWILISKFATCQVNNMKSHLNVTLHPSSEYIYARHRSEILRNIELFSLWAKVIKECFLKIQTSLKRVLLGRFHYWNWSGDAFDQEDNTLGDFSGRGGDVYWVIWVSIACAAHSGAAWRIFSKRLLTWKHRDWICLSQVGRGSRAAKKKERKIRSQGIKHLNVRVQTLCATF